MENRNNNRAELSYGDVINALYQGLLGRSADQSGLGSYIAALQGGASLADLIRGMIDSDEFKKSHPIVPRRNSLPDLTTMYPDKYVRKGNDFSVFEASSNNDFLLLESLMLRYRFYDSNDVYMPGISLDKRVTAALVTGLGAHSCIEMGCFDGSVLSLLADQGVDVCGVEVGHLGFVLAQNNVRGKIRFGDLLDLPFERTFDAFVGMDVLEHLNPIHFSSYVARIVKLINQRGYVYINSPMFGNDDIFGTVFNIYFPEWELAGEDVFWRHLHCDAKGWPVHGHLICASPRWWETAFLKHGLKRDRSVERFIQIILRPFFDQIAPARRSFFVLRHLNYQSDTETVCRNINMALSSVIAAMEVK